MAFPVKPFSASFCAILCISCVICRDCKDKYKLIPGHSACLPRSAKHLSGTGLSDDDKQLVLELHNKYRAMVKDATNMQKMAWDDDVAMIAQAWAENCDSRHDKERNVPGRFSVGQNLAYGYSSYEAAIKAWYDEVKMFSYGSKDMKLTDVGHFTQVAWATSVKLGCGFANCQGLKNFFVCNYGPAGNIAGFSEPYKKGAQGSDCPSKKDSDGLCDCGGKVCLNGGDVDLDSCTCKCNKRVSFYKPINDCELICSEAEDPYYCESQYKKEACSAYENVPGECPNMCNVCPWAGVKYAEGSVPVPLKGQAGHAAVSTTLTCVLLQLLVFLT